jgi:hypothetical protein
MVRVETLLLKEVCFFCAFITERLEIALLSEPSSSEETPIWKPVFLGMMGWRVSTLPPCSLEEQEAPSLKVVRSFLDWTGIAAGSEVGSGMGSLG